MAELKFDHSKDFSFLEILDMSEQDMQDLNKKFASISSYIITETPSKSKLVEKIAETFSYNELLLATTFFMIDKTAQIIKENPMVALLGLLKDLKED